MQIISSLSFESICHLNIYKVKEITQIFTQLEKHLMDVKPGFHVYDIHRVLLLQFSHFYIKSHCLKFGLSKYEAMKFFLAFQSTVFV